MPEKSSNVFELSVKALVNLGKTKIVDELEISLTDKSPKNHFRKVLYELEESKGIELASKHKETRNFRNIFYQWDWNRYYPKRGFYEFWAGLYSVRERRNSSKLLELIRNEDISPEWRRYYANALLEIKAFEFVFEMIEMLEDTSVDGWVRIYVAAALHQMDVKSGTKFLLQVPIKDYSWGWFDKNQDSWVYCDAAKPLLQILGDLNIEESIPNLLNHLKDKDVDYTERVYIAVALYKMNIEEGKAYLLNALKTDQDAFIIDELGELKCEESVPIMLDILGKEPSAV